MTLTPSWTRAFQVCSSFLMNLQRENAPNISRAFGSRRTPGLGGGSSRHCHAHVRAPDHTHVCFFLS